MLDKKEPMNYVEALYNAADLLFNDLGELRVGDDPKRKRALETLESIKRKMNRDPLSGRTKPDLG